jgi:hypothetical protein
MILGVFTLGFSLKVNLCFFDNFPFAHLVRQVLIVYEVMRRRYSRNNFSFYPKKISCYPSWFIKKYFLLTLYDSAMLDLATGQKNLRRSLVITYSPRRGFPRPPPLQAKTYFHMPPSDFLVALCETVRYVWQNLSHEISLAFKMAPVV